MPDLPNNETVLLRRRKHWLIITLELVGLALIAIAPFLLYLVVKGKTIAIGVSMYEIAIPSAFLFFFGSIWLLLIWMRAIGAWTDYYLDVWIVTNKRIIDREQKGLFHRRISILRADRIQDVTVETRGVIPTLFRFGDIHVQTAGEEREFTMLGIANPKYVRGIILRAQDQNS